MTDQIRNLYIKKLFEKYRVTDLPKLKTAVSDFMSGGKYNIFFFMHLGDDFQRLGAIKAFESQYGKVHCIIQPNEVFLMNLFEIKDYVVFDLKKWFEMNFPVECANKYGEKEYFYHQLIENTFSHHPQVEEPFIVFFNENYWPEYEKLFGNVSNITQYVNASLGIFTNKRMNVKGLSFPEISRKLQDKLKDIAPLDKTVLFLPEARSDELLNKNIWNALAAKVQSMGFTVIENITNSKNHIKGSIKLDLPLEELIALGMRCHSVFSLRSGLCDILGVRGKSLYVLWLESRYVSSESFFRFSSCYDLADDELPQDFILSKKQIPEIIWNGTDIASGIKRSWLPATPNGERLISKAVLLVRERGFFFTAKKIAKEIMKRIGK